MRELSAIDTLLDNADRALKTLFPGSSRARRSNPAENADTRALEPDEKAVAIGLMRVNHTGEVCAQALYQGQALTARNPDTRQAMAHAADEEIDHLAWCEERLTELQGRTSVLNPLFYAASWAVGAAAGLAGDNISLGFVAATEEQVCRHLREHLERLPADDHRSREILQRMLADEAEHKATALNQGGTVFPATVQQSMTALSRVMTRSTYYV